MPIVKLVGENVKSTPFEVLLIVPSIVLDEGATFRRMERSE